MDRRRVFHLHQALSQAESCGGTRGHGPACMRVSKQQTDRPLESPSAVASPGRAAAAAGRHLEVRGGMPLFVFEFSWSFPPSTASSWPLCGPPRPPAAVGTGKICRLCLLEDRLLSKAPSLGTGGRNAAQPTEADALAGPSGAFQAQPILRGEEERIPPDC